MWVTDSLVVSCLVGCPGFPVRQLSSVPRRALVDGFFFSGSFSSVQSPVYFDREDVKKAIHAPLNQTWSECSDIDVFPNGDASLPPVFTVLPGVIEKSDRSVIIHGLGDYRLIAEGTRVVLQKWVWSLRTR